MMNLSECSRIIDQAEARHDIDTMISALKEYQALRETLTKQHDAEILEWEKNMINGSWAKEVKA